LGTKYLVVLCAGSALLLVEDESTSVINGALVGVLLGQLASPSVVCLLLSRSIKLGFLTKGKPCCYIHHTFLLGFPTGWSSTRHQALFWRRCRGGSRRLLREKFFARTSFTLLFVLLYFIYFYLHHFIKNPKKLESLVVIISLL
jgi:hypothetical protein